MKDEVSANSLTNKPQQEGIETEESTSPFVFSTKQLIIGGLSFLLIITALTLLIEAIGVEQIHATIQSAGLFAPLIYIAIKALTYIFAPLSAGPIQLSSGVLFGLWGGVVYSWLGELIGGSISFWIARKLGRPMVSRFVGRDGMKQVDGFYERYLGDWKALAYVRTFFFSVYDFASYGIGLTPTPFRTYVIISAVFGFLPTLLFVGFGTFLAEDRTLLIVAYFILGTLTLIPLVWSRFRKSKGVADS